MRSSGRGGTADPERRASHGWFGPAGFATVVLVFSLLFVLISVNDRFEASVWWWSAFAALVFGALLAAFRGITRQMGVALILASSAVVIPSTVYPILAVLLFGLPIAAVCAVAGGIPYLIWLRRQRRSTD